MGVEDSKETKRCQIFVQGPYTTRFALPHSLNFCLFIASTSSSSHLSAKQVAELAK
ncbi:hypothetical protein COLO4_04885 [Corchorus olitorius]|uniref:Uncharacterized protein n=1 Tax=Corchorus olitorius TaxID=93759 RepID=A0A1R3KSJ1_9ROSI|nr:hypothetical protein COLO4_04885 [Corchorus olitorius]